MTFSLLAHDPETGELGLAVASRFFAVGAMCLFGGGMRGAVATQALVNPLYGPGALALLADHRAPLDIVAALTAPDPGRAQRQLHVMDATGGSARHTGPDCVPWAGHLAAPNLSAAGNMLAGPDVLPAMIHGFAAATGPLALRLIAALQAGEDAGGDKRGRQSAAIRVYGRDEQPDLDIRADDHTDPLAELRRLHRVSLERFAVFRRHVAGRDNPWGELDRTVIEAAIARDGQP